MGQVIDERRGEAERLRGYFEVQLLFAEILADRTARPLSDTCLAFTNLHWRLGLGRLDACGPAAGWASYATGLERCPSSADRLEWTLCAFAGPPPEAVDPRRFGCFRYDPPDPDGVVRIHFNNRDGADGAGPLSRAKAARRRAELGEMFAHLRAHHPDARTVRGASWLYNLEAYRRLFPPEYAASILELEQVRLNGTSSWGQLLDFRGSVKPGIRQALLENVASVDTAAPWRAFPLRALGAQSDLEPFHRFYGDQEGAPGGKA